MHKIITIEQITQTLQQMKTKKKSIILLGGCFDIIHAGHIEFLLAAKKLGGNIIVLLESDETVKKLKGKDRPINSQQDRAKILAHLQMVDLVVLLPVMASNNDYSELVKLLKPDIIAVTAEDPIFEIKKAHAELVKGRIEIVTPLIMGYSTKGIINKIKKI